MVKLHLKEPLSRCHSEERSDEESRCLPAMRRTKIPRYARDDNKHRRTSLDNDRFFVLAEHFAHGVGDFAYRGVGFHGGDDMRHQICS